jgi:hypothetical protein
VCGTSHNAEDENIKNRFFLVNLKHGFMLEKLNKVCKLDLVQNIIIFRRRESELKGTESRISCPLYAMLLGCKEHFMSDDPDT